MDPDLQDYTLIDRKTKHLINGFVRHNAIYIMPQDINVLCTIFYCFNIPVKFTHFPVDNNIVSITKKGRYISIDTGNNTVCCSSKYGWQSGLYSFQIKSINARNGHAVGISTNYLKANICPIGLRSFGGKTVYYDGEGGIWKEGDIQVASVEKWAEGDTIKIVLKIKKRVSIEFYKNDKLMISISRDYNNETYHPVLQMKGYNFVQEYQSL